jgi:hypothetical protein
MARRGSRQGGDREQRARQGGGPQREGAGLALVAARWEERTSMGRDNGTGLSLGDGATEGVGARKKIMERRRLPK